MTSDLLKVLKIECVKLNQMKVLRLSSIASRKKQRFLLLEAQTLNNRYFLAGSLKVALSAYILP